MSRPDSASDLPDDAPRPRVYHAPDAPASDAAEEAFDDAVPEGMTAREMRAATRAALAGPDRNASLGERLPVLLEQYRRPMLLGFAGLVALIFAAVFYFAWRQNRHEANKAEVAASERLYEQALALPPDQAEERTRLFQQALTTEGTRTGLKAAADDGDLVAQLYAANVYYELGQADNARTYFGKIGKGHGYVTATARAGEAAILENQNKPAEAAAQYLAAAEADDSKALAPQYLLSAARAFAAAGKAQEATDALDRLERDFPEAPEVQMAGLVRGMAQAPAAAGRAVPTAVPAPAPTAAPAPAPTAAPAPASAPTPAAPAPSN